jgi:hypothetical protein
LIRFVDLTPFYWCDEDPSNRPVCAFVNTCTGRFIETDGEHVFSGPDDVEQIAAPLLRERCREHVPDGFWERKRSAPDGEMAVADGEEEA